MLGSNPSADSVASTDPGDAAPSPFHLSAGTEPASGEVPKRKILGVRGQSPCATACFRSESRRPLIMRASMGSKKRKGDFSFESSPLLSDLRRSGSAQGLQLIAISELFGSRERSPCLQYTSVIALDVRASSVPSMSKQSPECFSESRCRFS
jgi:hypothetical protein